MFMYTRLSGIGHPHSSFQLMSVTSDHLEFADPDGDDSLSSVAQALHEWCEHTVKKELIFAHGSGAWSLAKPCYLRAGASDFSPREGELQG